MTKAEVKKLKVGDFIEVEVTHMREGTKKCTRKIVSIDSLGVSVRLFGWTDFKLKPKEIISKVEK